MAVINIDTKTKILLDEFRVRLQKERNANSVNYDEVLRELIRRSK